MRIAIVGSGIAGLLTARLLHRAHDVAVYEAAPRIGGHSYTVSATLDGRAWDVDMGFLVFNTVTYPGLVEMFARLGVASQDSDMSFSVRCDRSGAEWAARTLDSTFADRRRLADPAFWRMLFDIRAFTAAGRAFLAAPDETLSLRGFVAAHGWSARFVEHFLIPLTASIWSADPATVLEAPALFILRFLDNHGMLQVSGHVRWRAVSGGARQYVEPLAAPLAARIRTATPVRRITRTPGGVMVETDAHEPERFDHVVLALHAPDALALLGDASEDERAVLGALRYQDNDAVLHTDASVLPRRRRAWASWNYRIPRDPRRAAVVTYDVSRLMGLATSTPFCVTLNDADAIDPRLVQHRVRFAHPVIDGASVAAQARHDAISGIAQRTHYSGAYWRHGFHEDGVVSALRVAAAFGASLEDV